MAESIHKGLAACEVAIEVVVETVAGLRSAYDFFLILQIRINSMSQ